MARRGRQRRRAGGRCSTARPQHAPAASGCPMAARAAAAPAQRQPGDGARGRVAPPASAAAACSTRTQSPAASTGRRMMAAHLDDGAELFELVLGRLCCDDDTRQHAAHVAVASDGVVAGRLAGRLVAGQRLPQGPSAPSPLEWRPATHAPGAHQARTPLSHVSLEGQSSQPRSSPLARLTASTVCLSSGSTALGALWMLFSSRVPSGGM